ncbi:copper chaperone/Cu+-exporting ATPase [Amycolatopsis echigonensis]|uniref:Copper chaperone/Cu+-exporting ATPase n=2 Tax=Pseudonocardiaceae TaxID=2070 RepID=A0A2N3WJJ8_9PSEU|nr:MULTISPECIES: heavy-metal-associated domain-containing protein [Pseudonocardiaceae]AEA23533.1 Heavy metal transport/detoxification protein [Pseudonocardia dioxanivorans CB1190]PKV94047.1 copper chaperone/Cu+-exporting ATPase [Amycolatopsis niigatensis]
MESWVLRVEGMSCTGCAQRIGTVLHRVEGVSGVVADHTRGRVEVRVDPGTADRAVLVERIEAAGFRVIEQETTE